jgi:hypothetical protein
MYGLVEKPEGRPRRKLDDNIQMELKVDSRAWASFVWFWIRKTRRDIVIALMILRFP